MKNYELIAKLSDLPAGAEVSFECICDSKEVDIQKNDIHGELYIINRKVCCVNTENGKIILS